VAGNNLGQGNISKQIEKGLSGNGQTQFRWGKTHSEFNLYKVLTIERFLFII